MRVFVSSTSVDLKAHRERIIRVLNLLKLSPAVMEYFGSRADEPTVVCFDEIEACDLFIGIYGWRYGYQPEGPDSPSITELEFLRADELKKRMLCFIADDSTRPPDGLPRSPDDDLYDPGVGRLPALKKRAARRVVDRFSTPDDLAWKVAVAAANEAGKRTKVRRAELTRDAWSFLSPQAKEHMTGIFTAGRTDYENTEMRELAEQVAVNFELDALERDPVRGVARTAAFVGRLEFFGSMIYDRAHDDYIPFDELATALLMRARSRPMRELIATLPDADRSNLPRFVALCQSINLLKDDETFNGVFLETTPTPDRLRAPLSAILECTRASTFASPVSMLPDSLPLRGELTTKQIKAVIDSLCVSSCFQLIIEGGEPLARADLPVIIEYANRKMVRVTIATHGDAATPPIVDALQHVEIAAIKVRLAGASPETCDRVHGYTGAYSSAVAGIDRLRSLRSPVSLQFMVTRDNVHELEAMAALVKTMALEKLLVCPVAPVGRAASVRDRLLDDDDIARLIEDIDRVGTVLNVKIDKPRRPRNRLFSKYCFCGTTRCHIDACGGISPAGILTPAAKADTLHSASLLEIWMGSRALAEWLNRPQPVCPACDYYAV